MSVVSWFQIGGVGNWPLKSIEELCRFNLLQRAAEQLFACEMVLPVWCLGHKIRGLSGNGPLKSVESLCQRCLGVSTIFAGLPVQLVVLRLVW